jgi:hypothetical protein
MLLHGLIVGRAGLQKGILACCQIVLLKDILGFDVCGMSRSGFAFSRRFLYAIVEGEVSI